MAARWRSKPNGVNPNNVYRGADGWWYLRSSGPSRNIDVTGEDSAGNTQAVPGGTPQAAVTVPPGPVQPTPATPPPPPPPAFDPNESDQEGLDEIGGVQSEYDLAMGKDGKKGSIDAKYDAELAEQEAQKPLIDYEHKQANIGVDNESAGRGMFRSGIRQAGWDKNLSHFNNQRAAVARAISNIATNRQTDKDAATAAYNNNRNRAKNNMARRAWERYQQRYGVTGPRPS